MWVNDCLFFQRFGSILWLWLLVFSPFMGLDDSTCLTFLEMLIPFFRFGRCENCKQMAPTMELLHREYSNSMNFVMINADQRDSWNYIERFGVDAIPHMALISNEGDVETAMIGLIPKSYLDADIDVLLKNAAASVATTTSATATAAVSAGGGGGSAYTTLSMMLAASIAATASAANSIFCKDSKCSECEQQSKPTNSAFKRRPLHSSRDKLPMLKTRMTSVGRFSILSETAKNPR